MASIVTRFSKVQGYHPLYIQFWAYGLEELYGLGVKYPKVVIKRPIPVSLSFWWQPATEGGYFYLGQTTSSREDVTEAGFQSEGAPSVGCLCLPFGKAAFRCLLNTAARRQLLAKKVARALGYLLKQARAEAALAEDLTEEIPT